MRRLLLPMVASTALALWLGGLIALFVFVQSLFNTDRAIAVEAAPILFSVFETYQLILAGVAIAAVIFWRLRACSRSKKWLMALLIAAAALAVANTALVTTRMEALREQGLSSGPDFRRLHGYSMIFYTTEAAILLAAMLILPAAIRSESEFVPPPQTAAASAPA